MISTSQLSPAERAAISALLEHDPWFDFYWRCSLEDLERGLDNRAYLLGRGGRGVILGVHFDEVSIFSTVGELEPDELARTLEPRARIELHLRPHEMKLLAEPAGARLSRVDRLRYYRLDDLASAPHVPGPSPLTMGAADADEVARFYRTHYPDTIFSAWMLEQPFVGIREGGELVAAAGTIILSERLGACHVGHFLTHPAHRGRGLARAAARGLLELLAKRGIATFMLGVTEDNHAAVRVYESLGFTHIATRDNAFLAAR